MASATYRHLIPQNIAPVGAKSIGVYDSTGKRIGGAGLQGLALPTTQAKQYGFMAVSDSHIDGSAETVDSQADFVRALKYAEGDSGVNFTAICGDVVDHSGAENYFFKTFQNLRNKYATKPVYAITGNHESNNGGTVTHADESVVQQYFERPLYYSLLCWAHMDGLVLILYLNGMERKRLSWNSCKQRLKPTETSVVLYSFTFCLHLKVTAVSHTLISTQVTFLTSTMQRTISNGTVS